MTTNDIISTTYRDKPKSPLIIENKVTHEIISLDNPDSDETLPGVFPKSSI